MFEHARLADNLARVRQRIAEGAMRGGRQPEAIKLVAVTKYVGPEIALALAEAGCRELGESRPQELWAKAEALAGADIHWHLVGHLQRNKVARTLACVGLIHSVDSLRLIEAIDGAAARLDHKVPLLLEVNVADEERKSGFAPEAIEPVLVRLVGFRHVAVQGLMGMAPLAGGPGTARASFARLRKLRDRLAAVSPPGLTWNVLSMGMSGDFEAAIAEGATIVRIGSALFEGVV